MRRTAKVTAWRIRRSVHSTSCATFDKGGGRAKPLVRVRFAMRRQQSGGVRVRRGGFQRQCDYITIRFAAGGKSHHRR